MAYDARWYHINHASGPNIRTTAMLVGNHIVIRTVDLSGTEHPVSMVSVPFPSRDEAANWLDNWGE
jgi:hypothetical protein